MSKNASLILNLILVVAVVPLYLLHFSGDAQQEAAEGESPEDDSTTSVSTDSSGGALSSKKLKVAYVDWDTLMNEYQYVEDMLAELEKEQIRMRKELENKMRNLEQEVKELRQESTYMTQKELKQAQQNMQRKQQRLQQEQQSLQGRLARKRQKMLVRFFDDVNRFLEDYNEKHELDLILRYQRGGELLFADQGFDITQDVLQGLNEQYEEDGKEKELPEVDEDSAMGPTNMQDQSPLSP